MLNHNLRDEYRKPSAVERGDRHELLAEWRDDPQAVLDKADEANLSLDSYTRTRAPATAESPGPTSEFILYNQGVDMVDTFDRDSTPLSDFPEIAPKDGEGPKEPIVRMAEAYWDECYSRTLFTGQTVSERNAASVSNLTAGGPWRPIYDETPVRTPDIAPDFNFLDVVAMVRRIPDDTYRIPERKNLSTEQVMQELAEGTPPRLMELDRGTRTVELVEYGSGIEATDKFLTDNQTRVSDITNAVEEIALGHRITLLGKLGKLVKDSCPSANVDTISGTLHGVTHTAGNLEYPFWRKFINDFRAAYNPDITIGNPTAILSLDLMSLTADGNITYGSWGMIPGSGVNKLNRNPLRMNYGSINNTATTFTDTELYTWQQSRGVVYVMKIGGDQDETERIPGEARVRRWIRTTAGLGFLDPACIRSARF